MSDPLSRMAIRVGYATRQLPRMAWYAGHLYLMRLLAEQLRQREGESARPRTGSDPHLHERLKADMVALLEQDLTNIEAGIYPVPADHDGSLLTLLDRSRLFFRDLPAVNSRRKRNATREVLNASTHGRRPKYYLQNFHFQACVNLIVANAEAIPAHDNSCDAVTSVFMFHELPPKVRRTVMGEAARVLKPGGRLILVDSLQRGDEPAYDAMLESFPQYYHEPYYHSYIREDFAAVARPYGLAHRRSIKTYVSKVMVFDKDAG